MRFALLRALAAILSIPVCMIGFPLLCIKVRCPPLNEAHVSMDRFNPRQPLPHVVGFPYLKVLSVGKTPAVTSRHPCFVGLFGTYLLISKNHYGSPLFPIYHLTTCREYEPRKLRTSLTISACAFPPSSLGDCESAIPTSRYFGANYLIHFIPACYLPVYASQITLL